MRKILAIDDKSDNLVTIEAIIKNYLPDCKVLTAPSGKEGIRIARKEKPDTILLDIIMPGMDGYEVCNKLKADESTKNIPVIMFTAIKADAESRIKGLNIGADAFLSKPIDPTELSAQLNAMLRIKEAEDKLQTELGLLDQKIKERTKELSESENKYKLLVENQIDLLVKVDMEGRFLFVSPSFCKMFGKTEEELINNKFIHLVHEGDQDKTMKAMEPLYRPPHTCYIEQRVKSVDGWKWLGWTDNAILNDKGEVIEIIGLGRDITEQKRAEQIQKVLYNISNAVSTTDNLTKLISRIQEELGTIIDAANLYIALYDQKTEMLTLPFHIDEKDKFTSAPAGKTLTKYVINTKKPLLANIALKKKFVKEGLLEHVGSLSKVWLGVPLIIEGSVNGVLAVQHYTDEFAYDESDMKVLEFISDQISISIERKRVEEELKKYRENLEELVMDRTAELEEKNEELERFNSLFVGREFRIKELRDKVKVLEKQINGGTSNE